MKLLANLNLKQYRKEMVPNSKYQNFWEGHEPNEKLIIV